MHFCKRAVDCFNYYDFNPYNKVAEVIAYGDVAESGDKCCTNKLEIVREISWIELLEIVNTGKCCTGKCNTGNFNTGDYNSGHRNSGNHNSGYYNTGNRNSGYWNTGSCNSGDGNNGAYNSGNGNTGSWNTGNYNSGYNNSGNRNTGNCNIGNQNSGDWNRTNFSNGCFNTEEQKIYLFNKPSEWTYVDWLYSDARRLLECVPNNVRWVSHVTDVEKIVHSEAEVTGGYLKKADNFEDNIAWWRRLAEYEKRIIKAIPNFDKAIFKEITGIDVDM